MRTNSSGVTEVAHLRTNQDKFNEGWERIFGKKEEASQSNSQPHPEESAPRPGQDHRPDESAS